MILIIDANVLFSALIKDSLTTELIFNEELTLYTCDFILDEFHKYEQEIMKKTHRTREEFTTIMHQLKEIIAIIPQKEYSEFIPEAEKFSPDPKDVMYFALAIKLKGSIWSNDKQLKKQERIKVYSTSEILKRV